MSFRSLIYSTLNARSFKNPRLFLPGQENDAAANLITAAEEGRSLTPIGKFKSASQANAELLGTLGDIQTPKTEPQPSWFLALVDGVESPRICINNPKRSDSISGVWSRVGLSNHSATSLILQSWLEMRLWHVAGWSGCISVWLGEGWSV